MSIENVFTDIVIIHSNITDSSLKLIEEYAIGRPNIRIEQYPYKVFPHLHKVYEDDGYQYNNSLAAYYNFGLKICQTIGGTICKIDADQIYVDNVLGEQFYKVEVDNTMESKTKAGLWGVNSFVYSNHLYVVGNEPFNGQGDHYVYSDSIGLNCIPSANPVIVVKLKTYSFAAVAGVACLALCC